MDIIILSLQFFIRRTVKSRIRRIVHIYRKKIYYSIYRKVVILQP